MISENGCSHESSITKILPPANINVGVSPTVCEGTQVNLSASTNGFSNSATYQWQKDIGSGYINLSTNATSVNYLASQTGAYRVVVTDGLVSSTSCPINVTVNSLPSVSISSLPISSVTCAGSTVVLTSSASGNGPLTYQWKESGIAIASATQSSYSSGVSGSFELLVRDANGCQTTSASQSVTINPLPITPQLESVIQPTCSVATGTITLVNTGINTDEYSLDGTNYQSSPAFTGITAGTYTARIRNANGCISAALKVVVNAQPITPSNLSIISGPTIVASGSVLTYQVNPDNDASYYIWTLPNGTWSGSSLSNSIQATVGTNLYGTITVRAVSSSGCSTATSSLVVGYPEVPNVNGGSFISGEPSNPRDISGTVNAAANGLEIVYCDSNGLNCSTTAPTISTTPGIYVYCVKLRDPNSGFESSPCQLDTITILPSKPLVNPVTYCQNATALALTATANHGGTLKWYTLPVGGTSSNSAPIPATANQGNVNYYVSEVVNGLESARERLSVTIHPQPAQAVVSVIQPTCNLATGRIEILSPTANDLTYSMDGTNYQSSPVFGSASAGVYQILVKNTSACLSLANTITINAQPSTPSAATITMQPNSGQVCAGNPVTLTSNISTGNQWYDANGEMVGATSSTFVTYQSGTYSVKVSNNSGCISNASNTLQVQVDSPITASITEGATLAFSNSCSNNPVKLSVSTNAQNGVYQWFKDGQLIRGANTQTYDVAQPGLYTVSVSSGACSAMSASTKILPSASISSSVIPAVCSGEQVTLLANTNGFSNSATYVWQKWTNGNWFAINNATSTSYNANETGDYRVAVNDGAISFSCPISVLVNVLPVVSIQSSYGNAICAGQETTLTTNVVGANPFSYTWRNNGLNMFNETNSTFRTQLAGTFDVQVTDQNGCQNVSSTQTISVNQLPTQATVSVLQPTCTDPFGKITVNSPLGNGLQYSIDGTDYRNTNGILTNLNPGNYSLTVKSSSGCVGPALNVAIQGQPNTPSAPSVIFGSAYPFEGTQVEYSIGVVNGATSYVWTLPNGWTGISNAKTIRVQVGPMGGNVFVAALSNNGCSSSNAVLAVLSQPVLAHPDFAIGNNGKSIQGNMAINDVVPAGSTYSNVVADNSNPSGAVLSLNPDGTYTFNSPNPGVYEYLVSVCLPGQTSNCPTEKIRFTILDPFANNSLPLVNSDIASTSAGNTVNVRVLANDRTPNVGATLNPASVSILNRPSHGTVNVLSDGTISYTPDNGFVGSDNLSYQVCDNSNPANCGTSTLTVQVDPIQAPIRTSASDDFIKMANLQATVGNVLENDFNTHSNALSAQLITNVPAEKGTLQWNANGNYVFTPAVGFTGSLDVIYQVCDNSSPENCANATLHVLVESNQSFVADFNSGIINQPIAGNLSSNDTGIGISYGTPVANINNPLGANLGLNANGTYQFTASLAGTYVYTVPNCGPGQTSQCEETLLSFTVKDPSGNNNPPIINADVATVTSGTTVRTNVLSNDKFSNQGGNLNLVSLNIISQPAHGQVVINNDGTLSYTPNNGFVGSDVLTYQICQNSTPTLCSTASVSYQVLPTSNAAITFASDDYAQTKGTAQISGNVLSNDASTSGSATLSIAQTGNISADKGSISMNPNGTYVFIPANGFVGTVDVPYTICDQANTPSCVQATLHIVVEPSLTSSNDIITNQTNGVFEGNILYNDQIKPGNGIAITRQTGAGAGTATGLVQLDPATGNIRYTPQPGDPNTVTVRYTVCDNNYYPAQCASAIVSIVVCDPANPAHDCDNDGVSNGQELLDQTDPANPCSFILTHQTLALNNVWNSLDCDGDGVNNGTEKQDGTNPQDVCDYQSIHQNRLNTTLAWQQEDCDGDGTKNASDTAPQDFCIGGTGRIPSLGSRGYEAYLSADCDNDGIPNSMECFGAVGNCQDFDGDGIPNFRDADSDGDGLNDAVELNKQSDVDGWPNYLDLDSDNDGVSDQCEGLTDTDGDSLPNYLDLDADNDGILDAWETVAVYLWHDDANFDGTLNEHTDANGNGWADIAEKRNANRCGADSDGDTIPDRLDIDSDNDCIPDSVEFTADPDKDNSPSYRDTDSDGDGIPDRVEAGSNCSKPWDADSDGTPDYLDLDSDNDGIPDAVEVGANPTKPVDTDGDGLSDFQDIDSDNDGILDSIERGADSNVPLDTDKDGTPDYQDVDSDNDGIPDSAEVGKNPSKPIDSDGDGFPDYQDADSDNDSISDGLEFGTNPSTALDTDKDGTPDFQDLDSDDDGIPDSVEVGKNPFNPADSDSDGLPDFQDPDSDNDGIADVIEIGTNPSDPLDTDKDGTPDFQDLDSDNDGIPDSVEVGKNPLKPIDSDGDGAPDFQDSDSDNDSISDGLEIGTNPNEPLDTDKDGTFDYLDVDSDNDGIPDSLEVGNNPKKPVDSDGDGTPDFQDLDSDNDSIPDQIEIGLQVNDPLDTDKDGVSDYLDLDSDNDGIPDSVEVGKNPIKPLDSDGDGAPDFRDTDSDNDGIMDELEIGTNPNAPVDTDNDGSPDYLDIDSDNDGIPDSVEVGKNPTKPEDTDGDGIPDFQDFDSDNDGMEDALENGASSNQRLDTDKDGTPDYLDQDSDNDSLPDAIEAGKNPKKPLDTDGDGISDFQDTDSDNDGIPDSVEKGPNGTTPLDSDGDGIFDYLDVDSDNDGIPDSVEKGPNGVAPIDTDGDGISDYLDIDSDNDGIPDVVEAGKNPAIPTDTDKDGIPDYIETDSDNDGIPDIVEAGKNPLIPLDSDKDGSPDYQDLDADNDGIVDATEKGANGAKPVDTDGDGTPDYLDLDADNDSIPDAVEKGPNGVTPTDTDGDGIPNYLDLDSDNDGILDACEGILDTDKDSLANYMDVDSDNDGIFDTWEGVPLFILNKDVNLDGKLNELADVNKNGWVDQAENDPLFINCQLADTDKDGIFDYQDLDSDNDCILDALELILDLDQDQIPNYRDVDSDGDGMLDNFESKNCSNPIDTDKDGTPDYQDKDSDNDGIPDAVEALVSGGTSVNPILVPADTDKDGIPDYQDVDSDNDTILDDIEKGPNGAIPVDTDKDGAPDYRDLDSDSDGIADKLEDILNYGDFVDCDNDGVPNRIDNDECEPLLRQGISPNGDGINDVLVVPGVLSYKNKITVFNRWGGIVFETENYENNWGGQANKVYDPTTLTGELPDGMYYYIVDFFGIKPTVGTFIFINRQL
ncbi:Ig-like domain-containing protein [Aquirufa sp. ROCK2-A2]